MSMSQSFHVMVHFLCYKMFVYVRYRCFRSNINQVSSFYIVFCFGVGLILLWWKRDFECFSWTYYVSLQNHSWDCIAIYKVCRKNIILTFFCINFSHRVKLMKSSKQKLYGRLLGFKWSMWIGFVEQTHNIHWHTFTDRINMYETLRGSVVTVVSCSLETQFPHGLFIFGIRYKKENICGYFNVDVFAHRYFFHEI